MFKSLILHEELLDNLEPIIGFPANILEECCDLVLKFLSSGEFLSQRSLSRAAEKLDLSPAVLEGCLKALAKLFVQTTKQIKTSLQRCQTAFEHFGIPKSDQLAKFWFEKIVPKLSMFRFFAAVAEF